MRQYKIFIILFVLIMGVYGLLMFNPKYKTIRFRQDKDLYVLDIQYPQITAKFLKSDIRNKINQEIKEFVYSLFKQDIKDFVDASLKEQTKSEPKNLIEIDFEILRLDDKLISIKFKKHLFEGDVHGIRNIYGFNYDIKLAKKIKLKDLFTTGTDYLRQISDYCIKDLERQFDRKDSPWLREGVNSYIKEFGITKKYLVIYFSSYQVGSYSLGTPEIKIPFKKLLGIRRF